MNDTVCILNSLPFNVTHTPSERSWSIKSSHEIKVRIHSVPESSLSSESSLIRCTATSPLWFMVQAVPRLNHHLPSSRNLARSATMPAIFCPTIFPRVLNSPNNLLPARYFLERGITVYGLLVLALCGSFHDEPVSITHQFWRADRFRVFIKVSSDDRGLCNVASRCNPILFRWEVLQRWAGISEEFLEDYRELWFLMNYFIYMGVLYLVYSWLGKVGFLVEYSFSLWLCYLEMGY